MSDQLDSQAAAAVGWYPDPTRPGHERLWDGGKWVDLVRPAGGGQNEPNPARWHPDPHGSDQERLWSGEAWTPHTRPRKVSESGLVVSGTAEASKEARYADSSEPRKLATMGTVASVLLAFTILANLALLIANQRYIGLESDLIDGRTPDIAEFQRAVDDSHAASGLYLLTVLVAAVGFIAWLSRAYRNLPRRGITDLRYGPGWAVGAWFVPILNLFRPKQIANDVWRGSEGGAGRDSLVRWKERPVHPLLNWWWGCLILGSALSRVSAMSVGDANSGDTALATLHTLRAERTGLYIDQVASIVLIVAAILAIGVIRRISDMQDDELGVEGSVHETVPPLRDATARW